MLEKTFVLIVFLFSMSVLQAQLKEDKLLHFGAGALSGGVGAFVASELSDGDRAWTFAGAVGSSILAGVVKETVDANSSTNQWNNGDLLATVLGGLTVGVTIDLVGSKKQKRKKVALVLY